MKRVIGGKGGKQHTKMAQEQKQLKLTDKTAPEGNLN